LLVLISFEPVEHFFEANVEGQAIAPIHRGSLAARPEGARTEGAAMRLPALSCSRFSCSVPGSGPGSIPEAGRAPTASITPAGVPSFLFNDHGLTPVAIFSSPLPGLKRSSTNSCFRIPLSRRQILRRSHPWKWNIPFLPRHGSWSDAWFDIRCSSLPAALRQPRQG
jgi:hypothetical protein